MSIGRAIQEVPSGVDPVAPPYLPTACIGVSCVLLYSEAPVTRLDKVGMRAVPHLHRDLLDQTAIDLGEVL